MSQEIENAHIANFLLQLGEVQDTSKKLFNGLPAQTTGVWGESSIVLIDDPNYTGQTLSDYGTKKIYNSPGLYGSLGQENNLQQQVFNNPTNVYYAAGYYGQPIIRYNSTYCIVISAYKSGVTRYVSFLDLINGSIFTKKRKQVRDAMGFEMDYNSGTIFGMRWDTLPKDRLRYPGLQEYRTRLQSVDDNIFNPVQGSNFEINQFNAWNNG